MTNHQPHVSICIPTFNSERFLRACLDSIVSQTYKNYEVVISDNASTDATAAILQEYAERFGFKVHRNPVNIGPTANFCKLIQMAQGEYIAIYHADDVYDSAIVEKSVEMLDHHESLGLVGTLGTIINEDGIPYHHMRLPKHLEKLQKTIYTFDDALSSLCHRGWFFLTPTIMVRKGLYEKLGTFNPERYKSASDFELWLRIAKDSPIAVINESLINYRMHKDQHTETAIRKNTGIADIVSVLQDYKDATTNRKLRRLCIRGISGNIVKAARRQNYAGLYDQSTSTLRGVQLWNVHWMLFLQKHSILFLNRLKISFKKRRDLQSA